VLKDISDAVIFGDADRATSLIQQMLAAGTPAGDIMDQGLIAGMNVVGERFRDFEMFVPEVLLSAQVMQKGLDLLKPSLVDAGVPGCGKVVIATVEGDIHEIGKSLVASFLEGSGFEVIDLGVDVSSSRVIDEVKREAPQILALSSLLTSTMRSMQKTIEVLTEAGIREEVKVLVGGAPVTQSFADAIGADGYAPNAASAAVKARELIGR